MAAASTHCSYCGGRTSGAQRSSCATTCPRSTSTAVQHIPRDHQCTFLSSSRSTAAKAAGQPPCHPAGQPPHLCKSGERPAGLSGAIYPTVVRAAGDSGRALCAGGRFSRTYTWAGVSNLSPPPQEQQLAQQLQHESAVHRVLRWLVARVRQQERHGRGVGGAGGHGQRGHQRRRVARDRGVAEQRVALLGCGNTSTISRNVPTIRRARGPAAGAAARPAAGPLQ